VRERGRAVREGSAPGTWGTPQAPGGVCRLVGARVAVRCVWVSVAVVALCRGCGAVAVQAEAGLHGVLGCQWGVVPRLLALAGRAWAHSAQMRRSRRDASPPPEPASTAARHRGTPPPDDAARAGSRRGRRRSGTRRWGCPVGSRPCSPSSPTRAVTRGWWRLPWWPSGRPCRDQAHRPSQASSIRFVYITPHLPPPHTTQPHPPLCPSRGTLPDDSTTPPAAAAEQSGTGPCSARRRARRRAAASPSPSCQLNDCVTARRLPPLSLCTAAVQ
jgi:hypothetical protein